MRISFKKKYMNHHFHHLKNKFFCGGLSFTYFFHIEYTEVAHFKTVNIISKYSIGI